MSQIQGKIALITGGASGIGKLMGKELLSKGLAKLVIWDFNEALLKATVDEFRTEGFSVDAFLVNVMDTASVIATAKLVKESIGSIDILINNAGIIVGKYFLDHTHEDIDRTMGINSSALMHITTEFLPEMVNKKEGHIVNIASAAGLVSNPKMSVYVASKFSVVGWSDSLLLEMKQANTNVQVTTVTPFYINTGMFEGVKSSIVPIVKPEIAVMKIIRGVEKNQRVVRMPGIIYWVPFFKGILPASIFDIVIGKWFGMYRSMDEFKGRALFFMILCLGYSASFGQCKISQDKSPDGTMYQQTETSLMYQTPKKKIVERLSTDEENYFISISPSPFLPKPAGEKQKKDLIAFLSNGKSYKLSHFDSRYLDEDSSFQMLFLFDKKDIADFQKYDIKKIILNDGTAADATYTLVLHPDAVKKQFACFMKKADN